MVNLNTIKRIVKVHVEVQLTVEVDENMSTGDVIGLVSNMEFSFKDPKNLAKVGKKKFKFCSVEVNNCYDNTWI